MTFVLTGLDIEEKAALTLRSLERALGGPGPTGSPSSTPGSSVRTRPTPRSTCEATAQLRVTVKDADAERVGRRFSGAATELALAGYPGLHLTAPPGSGIGLRGLLAGPAPGRPGGPRGRPRRRPPGRRCPITAYLEGAGPVVDATRRLAAPDARWRRTPPPAAGPAGRPATRRRPLPARDHHRGPVRGQGRQCQRRPVGPLADGLGVARRLPDLDRFRALLPEADELEVRRYAFPNLSRAQLRGGRPARRGRSLVHQTRSTGQGPGRVPPEQDGRHPGRPPGRPSLSRAAPAAAPPPQHQGSPRPDHTEERRHGLHPIRRACRCCGRRSPPSPPSSGTTTT